MMACEWLTKEQEETLNSLHQLLLVATDNGLLDELVSLNGDVESINSFCDLIENAMK